MSNEWTQDISQIQVMCCNCDRILPIQGKEATYMTDCITKKSFQMVIYKCPNCNFEILIPFQEVKREVKR